MRTEKTLMVTMPINAYDILPELLGSSFAYWSWWTEVTYDEGYDWDEYPDDPTQPFLTLGILDPDDEDEEREMTKKVSVMDIVTKLVEDGRRDFDAASGDWVMQTVMFGNAVYC